MIMYLSPRRLATVVLSLNRVHRDPELKQPVHLLDEEHHRPAVRIVPVEDVTTKNQAVDALRILDAVSNDLLQAVVGVVLEVGLARPDRRSQMTVSAEYDH